MEAEKKRRRNFFQSFAWKMDLITIAIVVIAVSLTLSIAITSMTNLYSEQVKAHLIDYTGTSELGAAQLEGKYTTLDAVPMEKMEQLFGSANLTGIEGAYLYAVMLDGTIVYHKTASKIGTPIENSAVNSYLKRMRSGEKMEPESAEYVYEGETQYAAIYPGRTGHFIVVLAAPKSVALGALSGVKINGVFLGVMLTAIFATLAEMFTRRMIRPLIGLCDVAERMGKLDFRPPVGMEKALKQKDEIGAIARAIKVMQEELSGTIKHIQDQSVSLFQAAEGINDNIADTAAAVEQVKTAVHEMADGAVSQSNDTQYTTNQVVIMGNAVETTTTEVGTLYESTTAVRSAGDEAIKMLNELNEVSEKTKGAVDMIYEQTTLTNESVIKIQEATALITSIAEETNLLSLNASIEAARAGEHGRGFAVVASQIQKLAEQSNASAGRIQDVITDLMEDSAKTVSTMQEVLAVIKLQSEQLAKTEAIIRDVNDKLEISISNVDQISASTKSISETRQTVIDLVENLASIAEEYAANTEETAASATAVGDTMVSVSHQAESVKSIAQALDDGMSRFVLE